MLLHKMNLNFISVSKDGWANSRQEFKIYEI